MALCVGIIVHPKNISLELLLIIKTMIENADTIHYMYQRQFLHIF